MKKYLLLALLPLLLLTASLGQATTRPLVYRAMLAQQFENDPYEAYVFENTLGVTFTPVRMDLGQYAYNASGAVFSAENKVYMQNSLFNEGVGDTNICLIKTRRWDSDTFWVTTFKEDESGAFTYSDDCSFFFEILVYP